MKTILFILIILFAVRESYCQKEFNNWYFGDRAGITFNTPDGEPVALLDGALYNYEGCSSISDSDGVLLFYTNGITVWNRNHQIMINGTNLYGHESSAQAALIVPKPGSTNIYYIFTTDAFESNYSKGFCYSIVDMNLDNGLGTVTQKNTNLLYNRSEKVAAITSENGKETWIVAQDGGKKSFYAYLLNENGLSTSPVISPNSLDIKKQQNGMLRFSPNCDKLAMTHYVDGNVYLYDFNFLTGKITNEIIIKSHLVKSFVSYGLEFSDNGNFLYYTSINEEYDSNYLHQIDISSNNAEEIIKSEKIINPDTKTPFLGTLQMGPNKRIYLAVTGSDISVINNPDVAGTDCNFIFHGCNLNGRKSTLGLPSIVRKSYPILKKSDSIIVCEKDAIFLKSSFYDNAFYKWSGPEDYKSNKQNPVILNSTPGMSGEYMCKITKNGRLREISITVVTVNPRTKILFSDKKNITVCNDSLDLTAVENPQECKILWKELNSTENKVTIRTSGTYIVYVENKYGCLDSATVKIVLNQKAVVKIISKSGNVICSGDNIILSADRIFNEYLWSTSETTREITVKKGGKYYLRCRTKEGCEALDSINIQELEKAKVEFEKSEYIICKNDSLNLSPLLIKSEYDYIWSDGLPGPTRTIKQSSELYLIAKTLNGCNDTAYVKVSVLDFPFAEIYAAETVICKNGNVTLTAKNKNPDFEYLWSTGETSESIIVSESGKYMLTVKNKNMCSETDSMQIIKSPELNLKLFSDKNIICKGDSVKLYSSVKFSEYLWSNGETTESIFVKVPGIYSLIVKNEFGCTDTAFQEVIVHEIPAALILADKPEVCFGEKITLKAENYNPEFEYIWSTGEKGEIISISESGTYTLIIRNGNLCADTAEIIINVYPDLSLEIFADNTNLCNSDSAKISAKQKYAEYLWSTGETSETITVHNAGIYSLIAKNEFGCTDTAEIEIKKSGAKLVFEKENINFDELCLGESKIEDLRFNIETNSTLKINKIYFNTNNFTVENADSYMKEYINGESVKLSVRFKPFEASEFSDTIMIETGKPCFGRFYVPVYGSSKSLFKFSLPDITTNAGSKIEIPLKATLLCPDTENLFTDYEIEIILDRAYFIPESIKFGQITKNIIEGNNRIIRIKANADFEELSDDMKTINTISGQALIGRSETVPITINYVNFTNKRYYPEYVNGSIKINGCVSDLSGLIMFKKTTMLISPNPSDGDLKVTVGTQEEGKFSILIFDIQGREVAGKEFSHFSRNYEDKDFSFNIRNLGTGVYSVQLYAPWTFLQKELVIAK